jgi:hypothetical protein
MNIFSSLHFFERNTTIGIGRGAALCVVFSVISVIASLACGIASICVPVASLQAQDELRIFGFFQGTAFQTYQRLSQQNFRQVGTGAAATLQAFANETNEDRNVFTLQQANLFLSKDFGSRFSAFINLEFTDNYSSNLGWGSLTLQEAFMRYEGSEYFNVKAGLFLPQFNNLYEIYNRLPLLPYVFRPFIYETQFDAFVSRDDFLPSRALLQIYGYLPLGEVNVDYAAYLGSAENSYTFASNSVNRAVGLGANFLVPGWSRVSFKTVGARVGVRTGQLKAGASLTIDNDNQRQFNIAVTGTGITVPFNNKSFGDVPRRRIGVDAQYTLGPVTVSGEAVFVLNSLDAAQQDSLRRWSTPVATPRNAADLSVGGVGSSLDKRFFYGTAQFDVTENFYLFGSASYLEDNFSTVFQNGALGFAAGAGYKLIDQVVLKVQYQRVDIRSDRATLEQNNIFAGISVAF